MIVRLAVLTYDQPHLKTQQLVAALSLDAVVRMELYGLPYVPRPPRSPLFPHRPEMATAGHPREVAKAYGIPYRAIEDVAEIGTEVDAAIVAGVGLLPGAFVERLPVVNGHPGLIPTVRGLDAFKWAIHDGMPLGVSLHLLDAEVDAGRHLKSLRTPVYADDTLETLAHRHYELEILLLASFRRFLERPAEPPPGLAERPARKRMPAEAEREMIEGFPAYRGLFAAPPGHRP